MPLTRPSFDVHLELPNGVVAVHRVCYTHGDRLRCELEANARNVPLAASYNTTSIGLWCALVREGLFTQGYDKYVEQLIDWFPVATLQEEVVDPTQPAAPAGSPSSSPVTSPASTGSTRTSTSA